MTNQLHFQGPLYTIINPSIHSQLSSLSCGDVVCPVRESPSRLRVVTVLWAVVAAWCLAPPAPFPQAPAASLASEWSSVVVYLPHSFHFCFSFEVIFIEVYFISSFYF